MLRYHGITEEEITMKIKFFLQKLQPAAGVGYSIWIQTYYLYVTNIFFIIPFLRLSSCFSAAFTLKHCKWICINDRKPCHHTPTKTELVRNAVEVFLLPFRHSVAIFLDHIFDKLILFSQPFLRNKANTVKEVKSTKAHSCSHLN